MRCSPAYGSPGLLPQGSLLPPLNPPPSPAQQHTDCPSPQLDETRTPSLGWLEMLLSAGGSLAARFPSKPLSAKPHQVMHKGLPGKLPLPLSQGHQMPGRGEGCQPHAWGQVLQEAQICLAEPSLQALFPAPWGRGGGGGSSPLPQLYFCPLLLSATLQVPPKLPCVK